MDVKILMATTPCKNLMTKEKSTCIWKYYFLTRSHNGSCSDEGIFKLLHKVTQETSFPTKKWNKPEPDRTVYQE